MSWPISVKGILARNDKVLVLMNERSEWELPGGRVEDGQTLEDALKREWSEETGLQVRVDRLVDAGFYTPTARARTVLLAIWLVVDAGAVLDPVISDEHREYLWADLNHLPENLPQMYRRAILRGVVSGIANEVAAGLQSRVIHDRGGRIARLSSPKATAPRIGVGRTSVGDKEPQPESGYPERGDIAELVRAFRSGTLSPVEMTQARLERALQWQERTPVFVQLTPEAAMKSAGEAETRYANNRPLSPIDGVLVGLKDLIDLQGRPTTAGSRVIATARADRDAEVASALRDHGANLDLGKLNLHEYAYGPTGNSSALGPVANPYDTGRMAGGSSSGSAVAVATDIVSAALGTDTGGSIRIPAAFCGIVGLKPTYARVSVQGVVPLSWSLDHVGPMARRVCDVQAIWAALGSGPRAGDLPDTLTVFWPDADQVFCYDGELDQYVKDGIASVIQALGARVERGRLMDLERLWLAQSIVIGSESLAYHWEQLAEHSDQYQPDVALRLTQGGAHLAVEYLAALRFRQDAAKRWDVWMQKTHLDAIILPTVPITAPPIDVQHMTNPAGAEEDIRAVVTRFTSPFNFLGLPALSIPWGLHHELPVGLQLVGRRGADEALLTIGRAIQDRFPESLPLSPA